MLIKGVEYVVDSNGKEYVAVSAVANEAVVS